MVHCEPKFNNRFSACQEKNINDYCMLAWISRMKMVGSGVVVSSIYKGYIVGSGKIKKNHQKPLKGLEPFRIIDDFN